tara:strand:- start:15060 stop:15638 length:579 start_codon:yes stop_codon:yes gene_type:complete
VAAIVLSVATGTAALLGFLLYIRNIRKGSVDLNPATWMVWVVATWIIGVSYFVLTRDVAKSVPSILGAIQTLIIFLVALRKGRIARINWQDWAVIIISALAIYVWARYKSAAYANFIMIGCRTIAFLPTYKGVWRESIQEKQGPWAIWTLSHLLNIAVVRLRGQDPWQEYVYPVSHTILHSILTLMIRMRNT